MNTTYQLPDLSKRSFARTNAQTVSQRANVLHELLPNLASIAEICCGNCSRQWQTYTEQLGLQHYRGLDLDAEIVARNKKLGIDCIRGDALDPIVLRSFLNFNVIFFGPPLSIDCDGHQALPFREVTPTYRAFSDLLLGDLHYNGTFICIGPNTTSMGDITQLYHQVQSSRSDFGLRLIHHTYSTLTGNDEETELRLKYVELWFSNRLEDKWEVRESKPI